MPRVGYLIAFIKRLPHNKNIQVKKNALVQLSAWKFNILGV